MDLSANITSAVFTIALVTVPVVCDIALPFHPLLSLIHYNTGGVTGSPFEYQWIIYLYVLTSHRRMQPVHPR